MCSPEAMQWTFILGWYSRPLRSLGVMRKYWLPPRPSSRCEAQAMLTRREWTSLKGCQSGIRCQWTKNRNIPFVARVHALVDLVDQPEGCACQTLQGHEVEDGRNSALATRLPVVIEDGERLRLAERNDQHKISHQKKSTATYRNLTLIWIAHCSKSSSLCTPTSPAH